MKVSVIPSDNTIVVDGDARRPDGAVYPDGVHAIQWDGDGGTIERIAGPQDYFSDPAYVQPFVVLHAAAKQRDETPIAMTFAQQKAALLSSFRADRERMIARLALLANRAFRDGNAPKAAVCDTLSDALVDITTDPTVTSATDIAALELAMETLYDAAVYAAITNPEAPTLLADFERMDG